MYKALICLACAAVILVSGVHLYGTYADSSRDIVAEADRCQEVLREWAKWSGPDEIKGKMAFCQVEGFVSESDMKKALESAS